MGDCHSTNGTVINLFSSILWYFTEIISNYFLSWAWSDFSPRIVSISSCMKAQGTVEPCRGHLSPLGQKAWNTNCQDQTEVMIVLTSLPCLMMESLQQAKQNLWVMLLGHCTKWVSSSFPRQFVHLRRGGPTSPLPLLELDTWSGLDPGVGGPFGPV